MAQKKTDAQQRFDGAAHGWAFCNAQLLHNRITLCEEIVKELASSDVRHETLAAMKESAK